MRPFLLSRSCRIENRLADSRVPTDFSFTCVLSQYVIVPFPLPWKGNVENNGFEPLTPCLQSRCSSQLS